MVWVAPMAAIRVLDDSRMRHKNLRVRHKEWKRVWASHSQRKKFSKNYNLPWSNSGYLHTSTWPTLNNAVDNISLCKLSCRNGFVQFSKIHFQQLARWKRQLSSSAIVNYIYTILINAEIASDISWTFSLHSRWIAPLR